MTVKGLHDELPPPVVGVQINLSRKEARQIQSTLAYLERHVERQIMTPADLMLLKMLNEVLK